MNHVEVTACHECDLLIKLSNDVSEVSSTYCPRCHHRITLGKEHALNHCLAVSFSALLVLVSAISLPFLSFEAQGFSREISLIQASSAFLNEAFYLIALCVFIFIVAIPFLSLFLLFILTLQIKFRAETVVGGVFIGRCLSALLPWAMADVFCVGVLVALIKIIALADIIFGLAFWAYLFFTVLFIYVSSIANPHRLWHWIEHGNA